MHFRVNGLRRSRICVQEVKLMATRKGAEKLNSAGHYRKHPPKAVWLENACMRTKLFTLITIRPVTGLTHSFFLNYITINRIRRGKCCRVAGQSSPESLYYTYSNNNLTSNKRRPFIIDGEESIKEYTVFPRIERWNGLSLASDWKQNNLIYSKCHYNQSHFN